MGLANVGTENASHRVGYTSCCRYLRWSTRLRVVIVRGKSVLHAPWTSHIPVPSPSVTIRSFMDAFRTKVESRITSHGLTAADVQTFVDEIKKHPEVSTALLEEIRGEVGKLMQGLRFSFDFD